MTNTAAPTDTVAAAQALVDSNVPTGRMTDLLFHRGVTAYGAVTENQQLPKPLWDKIAATRDEARAYYASLDEEWRRAEAADVLAMGGWTVSAIWNVFS